MTREQVLAMEPGRELDALWAEHVLGLRVEVIKPDWYDREVMLFISPESGLIVYSYDTNGCNAMMYRNGKDAKDGIAKPLPYLSGDDADIRIVLEAVEDLCNKRGWDFAIHYDASAREYSAYFLSCDDGGATVSSQSLAEALCKAALLAMLEEGEGA